MGERIFTVSTNDGISRDVKATNFKINKDRTVLFYQHHEYVFAAMFNLDHVISVTAVELPTPEE